jgi:hypothetical protein
MRVWRSPTVFFGEDDAARTADSPRRRSAPLNETSDAVEWPPSYTERCVVFIWTHMSTTKTKPQ